MRAPPESLRPTIGAPIFTARSITLTILAALVSESDPPKTVKSWAKANVRRPLMRPNPATTPSPGTTWSAMPKSRQRWVTSASSSSKDPASNSSSMRSRASSLPASRWRCTRNETWSTSDLRALCLLPVLEEALQPDVGQRMLEALLDHRGRRGHHVRAHPRRFDDVNLMADAGDEDLRRVLEVVEDVDDLADQGHPGGADVVEPADERADVAGADLGGQPGLGRREDQRDVDGRTFGRQRPARLDAVLGEGHLDDDVLVDGGEIAPLAQHARGVGGDDLGADRAFHRLADLLEDLPIVAGFLGHQRRVRRHAVENADRGERFDVLQIAGVDK